MSFTPVGDTIKGKVSSDGDMRKQLDDAEVVEVAERVFADLFEPDLAIHVKPLFLKNRTLTVTTSSSAVATEIRLNQKDIVAKINDTLGKNEVDRIRYLA